MLEPSHPLHERCDNSAECNPKSSISPSVAPSPGATPQLPPTQLGLRCEAHITPLGTLGASCTRPATHCVIQAGVWTPASGPFVHLHYCAKHAQQAMWRKEFRRIAQISECADLQRELDL